MEGSDIGTVIIDILAQLPVLAAVWWLFVRPMMDAHKESIEYYRDRQKDLDEWMRRMMEVWSGQALETLELQAPKKPDRAGDDPI